MEELLGPAPTYYRYCVYYFYDEVNTKDVTLEFLPYIKGLFLRNPSECRMFIPGTYAEMHHDYD